MSDFPQGSFGCIVADPPWAFKTYSEDKSTKTRTHYEVMDAPAIFRLPVRAAAAKDCSLFLWATGPHLPLALQVVAAWGFKYSGMAFTWVKLKKSHNPDQLRALPSAESDLHCGMGYTTRKNAEFCLLGRRGAPKRLAKDVREVILSPRREHSRKPDEFYSRVEAYCAGPRLELFARQSRAGWVTWGSERTKFDA